MIEMWARVGKIGLALLAGAFVLGAAVPAGAAAAPTGALTQLLSPNDCISDTSGVCGTTWPVANLGFSYQAIVSPDGRNVYWIAENDSLHEFARDPSTGALTALASPNDCITDAATGCGTVSAPGMGNPGAITISPDGAYVYVATQANSSIAEFSRNPLTGALTEIGCLSESDPGCTAGTITGMTSPYGITITSNGQNVYASSPGDNSVAEFSRNTTTGALTQLAPPNACITANANACGNGTSVDPALNQAIGVNASPDGSSVYVSAGGTSGGGDIDQFAVGSGGALTPLGCVGNAVSGCAVANALGLNGTEDLAFTPNGQFAYGNSFTDSDISEFSRNTSTGALTYQGCIGSGLPNTPTADNCSAVVKGVVGALGVAVSPDGLNLYASSAPGNSEAAFSVDPTTGLLTQLPAPNDCVATGTNGSCSVTTATGLNGARRVTVSPDGLNVYVAGQNDDGLVELARTPSSADLTLAASAPSAVTVGSTFASTFTVADAGPDAETSVSFSDTLPFNTSLVSATTSTGAPCTGTTTVTCALGARLAGVSSTVTVTLRSIVAETATQTATATGTTPDPNTANNTAVTSTSVILPNPPQHPGLPLTPVLGQSGNLLPVSGIVTYELPHSSRFIRLTAVTNVPIGTIINATHGRVTLVFALPNGKTETIVLYGGEFRIASQNTTTGLVTFVLVGPLHSALYSRVHAVMMSPSVLFAPVTAVFAKHHPKSVQTRSLWGSENSGNYTTQGSDGAATVRGTTWVTEDFKGYSRFYVAKGAVSVTDFRHHHRKVSLKAGQCYQTSTPKHCTPTPFERSGG